MTTLTTRISTALFGQLVGSDAFGNRYYRRAAKGRERRWVLYKGAAEASKVPAEWHGWLHHTFDIPPTARKMDHYAWEKPHLPNLSGTQDAYLPGGSLLKGGKRQASVADYEAWKP